MRLTGTEVISIELSGSLSPAATGSFAARVPAPLAIARDDGGAGHVSVLVLEMHGLGLARGLPRFDYREVLYRLGVTVDGQAAWLALRCDLDRALVRAMAARIIRYPVCGARIDIDEPDARTVTFRAVTDGDVLAASLRLAEEGAAPAVAPPRRTFVIDRGRLYEVPWDERAAPVRAEALVSGVDAGGCTTVFGAGVDLDARAIVHRGRGHVCGAARRHPGRESASR